MAEWVKRMSRSFEPYGEIRIIVDFNWHELSLKVYPCVAIEKVDTKGRKKQEFGTEMA